MQSTPTLSQNSHTMGPPLRTSRHALNKAVHLHGLTVPGQKISLEHCKSPRRFSLGIPPFCLCFLALSPLSNEPNNAFLLHWDSILMGFVSNKLSDRLWLVLGVCGNKVARLRGFSSRASLFDPLELPNQEGRNRIAL